jgi:hypothetical protein
MLSDFSSHQFLHIWNITPSTLSQVLSTDLPCVFLAYTEWQYDQTRIGSDPVTLLQHLLDHNRALGAETIVVSAAERLESEPDIVFVHWPTFFCFSVCARYQWLNYQTIFTPDRAFCSLNRNAHLHRCVALDLWARDQFLEHMHLGWSNRLPAPYQWRWTSGRRRSLTEQAATDFLLEPPAEYYRASVQLVAESTADQKFLTEKTLVPVFLGQPFQVYGCAGFTDFLSSLGFQPYTELVAPGADLSLDLFSRYSAINSELRWVSQLNTQQLSELRSDLSGKISANQTQLRTICSDIQYIPELLQKLYVQNTERFWQADAFVAEHILAPLLK